MKDPALLVRTLEVWLMHPRAFFVRVRVRVGVGVRIRDKVRVAVPPRGRVVDYLPFVAYLRDEHLPAPFFLSSRPHPSCLRGILVQLRLL